jgi:CheY-like chemotaxis protein
MNVSRSRGKSTSGSLNRPRPKVAASGRLERLRIEDRERDQIGERNISTGAKLCGLPRKGFDMPVSTANGVKANVVLVVEDEFFLRYGIASALREAGYAVVECGSGEEAVALCRSKAPIDVLFTDINLGGSVSGWEVAERFRLYRPDGVVLYTSANGVDPKRCCADSVFVSKPYLHCDILSVCERLRTK